MSRLWSLFSTRSWWLLEPDDNLVNNGRAALATDGSWALAYVTSSVTVQLSRLVAGGSIVSVSWFNPYSGTYTPAGNYPTSGTQTFSRPTSDNGNGNDWLLVLEH
jgi:hypothetical protein